MAKAGYSCTTEGAVTLTATTAESIIGVAAPAQFGVDLKKYRIAFNGVTATDAPVLVELCASTFATNGPGTNSTSTTVLQDYGRAIVAGFTSGKTWTVEPTVLTVIESYLLTPNGGTVIYDWPLGESPDNAVSTGFVIRCTAPTNNVAVRATLQFERC